MAKIEVKCSACGKLKLVSKCHYNEFLNGTRKNFFCSNKCQWDWRKINGEMKGENHPRFRKDAEEIEVKCSSCGKLFWISDYKYNTSKTKIFNCSKNCNRKYWSDKLKQNIGDKHPNYSQVTLECFYCGKVFNKKKSHCGYYEHHFCSRKCYTNWLNDNSSSCIVQCDVCNKERKISKYYFEHHDKFYCDEHKSIRCAGERNYAWKGYIDLICPFCGNVFKRKKSYCDTNNKSLFFCSRECRYGYASEHFRGENHPNWTGGNTEYGSDFTDELKKYIREHDDYTCAVCNKIQNGKSFPVHHIDYDKMNNDEINLITLCESCHLKTNFNREYWIGYFKPIMEDKYSL